jgi:tRNA(Ile)-lysidine synthase
MTVLEAVQNDIKHRQLLESGSTVVVAVSGGPDSLCLLHILNRLRTHHKWSIHIAHLNHCLREIDADEDMLFVAQLALKMQLPCTIEAVNVISVAQEHRLSLEEAARQVRYGFLADVARRVGAHAVAVGHHADDQSETVLMHLLRGTGLAGLRGMLPSIDLKKLRYIRSTPTPTSPSSQIPHVRLIRPLLSVTRAAIENYCRVHSLSPRFDRSNLDTTIFRNRLRHELLPLLETYNPNIRALLWRTAELAAVDHATLTAAVDDAWEQEVTEENENHISFDLDGWRALPLALQRATLRRAAYQLRPRLRDVDFIHVKAAVDVASNGSTGAQATLPQGLLLSVGYQTLRLAIADAHPPAPNWPLLWNDEPIPVAVPGKTHLPSSSLLGPALWSLEAGICNVERNTALINPDRWTAYLDMDQLDDLLTLRRRRPGDRFQPLGMDGNSVLVSDFMINAKIPRRWREHIPLLVHNRQGATGEDKIAWIVGWRIDERAKIAPKTHRTVRLRWHQAGHASED